MLNIKVYVNTLYSNSWGSGIVNLLCNTGKLRKEKEENLEICILLINTRLLGKSRYEVTPCLIQRKSQSLQEPSWTFSMQWQMLKYSNITPSTLIKHVVYRAFFFFQSLKPCQVISFLWEHWNGCWSEPSHMSFKVYHHLEVRTPPQSLIPLQICRFFKSLTN